MRSLRLRTLRAAHCSYSSFRRGSRRRSPNLGGDRARWTTQTAQRERPPVAPAVVLPLWMRESIAEIVADLGETARDISERLALGSGTLNPSVRSPRPLQDHLRRHGPQHHYKTSTSRCLGRPRGGGVLDRSHRLRSACCCVGHSSAHSTKVPLRRPRHRWRQVPFFGFY